ncbi:mucin-17-like [Patiria miniata]|uniref:HYR domain-containing protein n=1 Tax=Patiria miniata TaxID=46514 RepID=A0A913ZWA9_PATMI|nr:mucin-17-like [Patiria miniata]
MRRRGARPALGSTAMFLLAVAVLGLMGKCEANGVADTYEFEEAVYTVAEDVGSATVYVIRTGPHDAPNSTVDVATSDGTAVAVNDTDYTAVTDTLDFQLTKNRVALSVPIMDNDVENEDSVYCFTLTLSNPNPVGTLGANSQVCIIENDNYFGGTCPPPEAVIESNGQAVIEVNVTSASDTAVITWTDPTPAGFQRLYTCFPIGPSDHECNNGDSFPISYTFTSDGYNRRILVTYTVYTTVGLTMQEKCDFYLRVLDPFPPEITCPSDIVVAAGEGIMNGTADWVEPVGTDNSDVTTNSYSPPLFLNIGSHEFTYTAVDSSGNEASCSFNVAITDGTAPEIDCPANIDTDTDPQQSYATVLWSAPNVTDNSGEMIEPVLSSASGSTFEIGNHTVEVTATDSHNNTGMCSFTVIVRDLEPPVITCPANMTVPTNASVDNVTLALPDLASASDNLGTYDVKIAIADILYSVGESVTLYLATGEYALQYNVTDPAGNSESCYTFFTVVDEEAPTITCPSVGSSTTDLGLPTANVSFPDATASDNSMLAVTFSANATSDTPFNIGDTVVQFVATDNSGNTDDCFFTITVIDDEDPVVDCPMNIEVDADLGQNYSTVMWHAPNVTDNSGESITPTLSHNSGDQFPFGLTTVTVNATDSSFNVGSCAFTVYVLDPEPPMITCPDNQTRSTDLNVNHVSLALPDAASASDNSGSYVITIDVAGSIYSVGDSVSLDLATGQHLLQYIITDNALNNDTCEMYVTVIDDEDPRITCPAAMTVPTDAGLATANVTWELATVVDNSMLPITPVDDPVSGSILPIGDTTVRFNATDESGNSAYCTFVVTVEDMEPPSINCTDLTFSTSPGLPTAYVTYDEPPATDNVGVMNTNCFYVETSGQVLGVGMHQAICVATDSSDERLTDVCTLIITVEDNETPNITCPANETVATDGGAAVATFVLPDLDSSVDNTENFTVSIDVAGAQYDIGDNVTLSLATGVHLLQYTATDFYNNSEVCDMFVTVIDDEDPMITCPAAVTVGNDAGLATANVTWELATVVDNSMLPITPVDDPVSGSILPIGDTTVQFNATDESGNTASCTFVVTVGDDEDPVVDCPMDIEVEADPGQNYATVMWSAPNVTDNSGESITPTLSHDSGDQFPFGLTTVTVNATDSSFNLGSCAFTVNVLDLEPPMIICPDNQTNSTDLSADDVVVALPDAASASDNSGSYVITIDVAGTTHMVGDSVTLDLATGQHLLQYIISDNALNNNTCDMFITVIDDEDPRITCPAAKTVPTGDGLATANVFWARATVVDNSMLPITPVDDPVSGSILPIGDTTVRFNATDESGNSAYCTFVVTVEDDEDPVVDCPMDIEVDTDLGQNYATVMWYAPNVTDNSGESITPTLSHNSGDQFPFGLTTVTVNATDSSLNNGSCSFTVNVLDLEPPMIICPENQTNSTDLNVNHVTVALPDAASASDNSGSYVITIDVAGSTYMVGNSVTLDLATGQHLLQYIISDNALNNNTCDMFITVIDDEDPRITCPAAKTVPTDDGLATANVTWELATVMDNSMLPIQPVDDPVSGSSLPIGDTTVRFNATDESGNSAYCTFVVTVEDDEDPVVDCPMDIEVDTDLGQNYATVMWHAPNVTDNSGESITPTLSHNSGDQFPFGLTTVTVNATDSSFNLGSCSFTVNVLDLEPPMIICPENQTNSTDLNADDVIVALPDAASASDNSGSYVITIDVAGSTYMVGDSVTLNLATGQHLLQYIISDNAMNNNTCDMFITVIDEEDPVLTCPEDQMVVVPDNQLEATVTWLPPTVTDNSGEVPEAFPSQENGTAVPIGVETTIFYNATDSAGNTGYCDFTILVIDNVPPVITCPATLTEPTAFNKFYGPVTWVPPTVTDNVPATVTVMSDYVNGSNFDLGDTVVTLTAIDAAGNNDTCQFTITIVDLEPPVIYNCSDDFNVTTEPGEAYGIPVFTEPTAQDNSGSVTIAGLGRSGTQFSIGPTEVTYVAIDAADNPTVCRLTILVIDDECPTIQSASECPADIVEFIQDANSDNLTVTWTDPIFEDNSGIAPTVTVTPLANNSFFPEGNTTVTIVAEDQSGNQFECVFLVTINVYDMTPPVFSSCPPTLPPVTTDPGLDTASPFDFGITVSDTGSGVESAVLSTNMPYQIGDNLVSLFARDFAGNVDYCNFNVTVSDNEMPNITSCPLDQTVFTRTDSPYGFPTWMDPVAVDNSGVVTVNCSMQSGDAFVIADTTVVCTAWDPSNNMETCSFIVTVVDNQPPVVTFCPENINQGTDAGEATAVVTFSQPTATDNDGLPIIPVGSHPNNSAFDLNDAYVSFTFTDSSDNVAYCNFTITVVDDEAPTSGDTCPNDTLVYTPTGRPTAPVQWVIPMAFDNVGVVGTSYNHLPGNEFPIAMTTVVYTSTDAAGNVGTCQFVVEVQDTENPVFDLCPLPITQPTDQGSPDATVFWTVPNVTDNSGIIASLDVSNVPGEMFSIGPHTVTYTAVDEDNNIGTCSFPITVSDDEAPVLENCQNNVTLYVPPDSTQLSASWPFPTATDNAGPPTVFNATYTEIAVSQSPVTVTIDWQAGFVTVQQLYIGHYRCIIRAEDAAGNSVECVTELWILDDVKPVFDQCPPVLQASYPTDLNLPTAVVSWTPPNVTDNSGGTVTVDASHMPGMAFDIGVTTVTLDATDDSGNMESCVFNVTVVDDQRPNVTCPTGFTLYTDPQSNVSTGGWSLPDDAFDNSGVFTATSSLDPTEPLAVSNHHVSYTVVDAAGNDINCDFYITVLDNEDPYFEPCPASLTFQTDPQQNTANVSWPPVIPMDNDAVQEYNSNYQPGHLFPIGDTDVEYNVTDTSGNKGSCFFVVTVEDMEPPTITCPDPAIVTDTDPQRSVANVTFVTTAADNSGEWTVSCTPASATNFQVGVQNVMCIATDPSDNTETCSFAVLVSDNEDPVFDFCPSDITLNEPLESFVNFTIMVNWTQPVVTDNVGVVRLDVTHEPGSVFGIGSHLVTYTAYDAADNMATCQFNIFVNDVQPPVITGCPMNLPRFPTDPTRDTARAFWDEPQASDNSGSVTLTSNYDVGDAFPVGDTVVVYTAEDGSGNAVNCSFVVQVYDNEPPAFTGCPFQGVTSETSLQSDRGVASWSEPQGTDNVAVANEQSDYQPGDSFPLGATVVTYNVTDTAGLVAECSFTVLIQDNEDPVLECPEDITVNIFTHQGSVAVNYTTVNATDYASGLDTLTCSVASGSSFSIGTNDVTCTAEDLANNVNFCIFRVIVVGSDDTILPVISNCPMNITLPSDNTTSTTIVSWTPPTATDNSGDPVTLDVTTEPGSPFGLGVSVVTYTATDAAGLVSTCDFSVTILDLENPHILQCPADITRPTDSGMDSAVVDWASPGAIDNSGTVTLVASETPGSAFYLGVTFVTYTATDTDDNVEQCIFMIEIIDEEDPVITGCPTVQLQRETEPGQNYSLVMWDEIAISDNSGNWTVETTGPSQGRINVGDHQVTYVATDSAGNTAQCSFSIRVIDTELPVFSNCPTEIIKLVNESGRDAVVTWNSLQITDNVGVDAGTLSSTHNSGDTFPFGGPTTVTVNVADVNGNTNFCSFTVTVSDAPQALSNCPVYIQRPTDTGVATAVVTWNDPDVEPQGASFDTQSTPYTSGDTVPLGRHNVTTTVFVDGDFNNPAQCTFVVEVVDNEPPSWTACPGDASITPSIGAVNASVTWPPPMAQDNSGSVQVSPGSHNSGDLFPIGQTTVTYTASDAVGHVITCSFLVTVRDLEDPVVTCPEAMTVNTDPSKGTATLTWTDATASDNVAVTSLLASPANGSPLIVGENTITYTAMDFAQNSHSCSFIITVIDNEPPVFSNCPSVASAVAATDQDMAIVVWDLPSASDNAVTVTVQSSQSSAALYPLGVTPIVYLATDSAGNKANCTFDAIVTDSQIPVFSNCPGDLSENTALNQAVATGVVWTPPTASDNDPQLQTVNNFDPPTDFPEGVTVVNYTAVDRAGNTASCIFTVTVTDMEDPVYTGCPASFSVPADMGTTTANVSWIEPTASDNVAVTSSVSDVSPNTIFNFGATVVEYTAMDAEGNTGNCIFTVTILDSNAPRLVNCPSNQMFCADQGTLSRSVDWIEPTATDIEGAVTLTSDYSPGDTFNHTGTPTPVTYTATDESSMTASCTFDVTIDDCEKPVISNCPAGFNLNGDLGGGSVAVSWTEPTATDNSGQYELNRTHAPGEIFTADTSPVFVQYAARDPSGNVATCVFMVVVTDTTAPVLRDCPSNQSITTDANSNTGSASWTPPTVDSTPTDPVNLVPSHQPGAAFPVGTNPVTYTATDASGNQVVCKFWIIVRDNQLPTITCPADITREVASGIPSDTVSWDPPVANDNNGVPTIQCAPPSGTAFDVGMDHIVTCTATDSSGNIAQCTITVSIVDAGNAILITCPDDININTATGQPNNVANWDDPTTSSSSPASITLTPTIQSGSAFGVGVNTVMYTASDGMGNTATCSFTVTVSDMEPPVFQTCPDDIIGIPTDDITWTTPTVTDNTVIFTLIASRSPGMFSLGVHHVTYTATDDHNNQQTCTFTITIEENNKPMVSNCPVMLTRYIPEGESQVAVTWTEPTATDQDGIARIEQNFYPGQNFTLGAYQVTYMFIDNAGFAATCQFVLNVERTPDTTPPDITNCPMDQAETLPEGQIKVGVSWTEPTIVDARGTVSVDVNYHPGDLFSAGTTQVVYVATDGAGNTANCTFNVHVDVIDTVNPFWSGCPGDIQAFVPFGTPSKSVTWTPPTASDAISSVTTTASHTPGAQFNVGDTQVVYKATDVAGNRGYCNFTITITEAVDTQDPIINGCPMNITREVNPGITQLSVSWTPPTAIDDFGTPSFVSNYQVGHTFAVGTHEVVYTATDGSGNSAECRFSITITALTDSTPPTISNCPANITRRVGAAVTSIIVAWTPPTASDDFSGVSLTTTHNPSNSFQSGTTVVTYTAEDGVGNTVTCVFSVNIINDATAPVFVGCPSDVGATAPSGQNQATASWTPPTATDDSGEPVNLQTTHEPPTLFNLGMTTVTYTAFDNYGNSDTCSFVVDVVDDQGAPTILNCPDSINHYVASGVPQANVAWTAPTALPASATLTTDRESGTSFNAGTSTLVTYTATDDLSRSSTCSFTVAVIVDTQAPVIANCPANIAETVPQGQTSLSVSWTPPVATDNSGQVTLTPSHNPGDSFTVQTTPVTYTATDPFGLTTVCQFTVTITVSNDNTLPVISNCPSNIARATDTGLATASVTWTAPTATDDQGAVTLTSDISPGFAFPIGMTEVTYTAIDGNNNQVTCVFTVTVTDEENPTLANCPQSFTLSVAQATDQAIANWTPPTASDNSGTVTRTTTFEPGQSLSVGQYPVTYTAMDPAGLTATCMFTVTVQPSTGCNANPCNNGGACIPAANNGFTCSCTSFWMGTTCDEDVNECASAPATSECSARGLSCFNRLDPVGYTCDCPVGFVRAGNSDNCLRARSFRFRITIVEINGALAVFVTGLGNSNTVIFLSHQIRLQVLFALVFSGMPGFGNVVVLFFSPGSIVVEAVVNFDPSSTVTQEDVNNAVRQGITTGDLLMGSEYKVTPSPSVVIEEVCVDGYCQNGGTCAPSSASYLSTCICPSGYGGDRCQSMIVTTTTPAPGGGGLSTEAIIAIAVGAAVALLLILLISLAVCYLATRGRGRRSDYLYREDYEGDRGPKHRTNGSVYDVQFQPRENNGYRPSAASQFSVPYMASGREAGIPLHRLIDRGDADYY